MTALQFFQALLAQTKTTSSTSAERDRTKLESSSSAQRDRTKLESSSSAQRDRTNHESSSSAERDRTKHDWALALVTKTKGSVPRKAGAIMAIQTGIKTVTSTIGSIGGGAAEAKVIQAARTSADDQLVDIDLRGADGICGGQMQVAIRHFDADQLRTLLSHSIASLQKGHSVTLSWLDQASVTLPAKPIALIAGGGHCGAALLSTLERLGYPCVVIDDRADSALCVDHNATIISEINSAALPYINPKPIALLLTRNYQLDIQVLRQIADSQIEFQWIAMMGSKRRAKQVLSELVDSQLTITTPIGLDIGAETPEEIAISIAAQVVGLGRGLPAA
jgi:xanthine dehydrogenase accessory factor